MPAIQQPFTQDKQSAVASSSIFRGFTQKNQAHFIERSESGGLKNWKGFYESGPGHQTVGDTASETPAPDPLPMQEKGFSTEISCSQVLGTYIITASTKGFILIHQQAAHERVLYEGLLKASKDKPVATQRSMFPSTLELAPADAAVMEEIMTDLHYLGYIIEPFGKNTYVIQGTPADVGQGNEKHVIDILLEQYKHFNPEVKFSKREKLIRSLARQQSIKTGTLLSEKEMRHLVQDLFACEQSNISPDGNPTYLEFKQDQLERMFGK